MLSNIILVAFSIFLVLSVYYAIRELAGVSSALEKSIVYLLLAITLFIVNLIVV